MAMARILDGDGVVTGDVFRFPPRYTIGGALLASRHDLFEANGGDPTTSFPKTHSAPKCDGC